MIWLRIKFVLWWLSSRRNRATYRLAMAYRMPPGIRYQVSDGRERPL